jgi:hypothetical protein
MAVKSYRELIVWQKAMDFAEAIYQNTWIANGSTCESETQILLSERLGYIDSGNVQSLLNLSAEIGRLNSGLRRSLTTDH